MSSDFQNGASTDTILDTDGTGSIKIDDAALPSFLRGANNVWYSANNAYNITVSGVGTSAQLTLTHTQSGSRIIVKDWGQGELGITLPGYGTPFTENQTNPLTGNDDLWTPLSVADYYAGVSFAVAKSKDGNNVVSSGEGDDYIESGFGDDVVSSGAGDDIIKGGPGNDILTAIPRTKVRPKKSLIGCALAHRMQ